MYDWEPQDSTLTGPGGVVSTSVLRNLTLETESQPWLVQKVQLPEERTRLFCLELV